MTNKKDDKVHVLMCGSKLNVKGGMVTVTNNYLTFNQWEKYQISYIPTHVERNKVIVSLYFLGSLIRIVPILVFQDIDIIHMHTAERGSFYRKSILARIGKQFGAKVIMHHHAAYFDEFYQGLTGHRKMLVDRTLDLVDVNLVLSKKLVPMIRNKAPHASVEVLYNATETQEKNPYSLHAKTVLFLGRLGVRKGVYDLIEAIKQLDSIIDPEITFALCGDGEVQDVQQRIASLHLEHRISHLGWVGKKDKEKILLKTMIHVLPSYNEGLPMSILETMSYGIPNISTNIASIPEVILHNKNGLILEAGDIRELSKHLLVLISDSELRKKFSDASYNLVKERHSLESNIQKLKGIYDQVLKYS